MDYGYFSRLALCEGAEFSGLAVDVLGHVAVARQCDVCLYLAFF
jgi:hypothetical protein